MIPGQNILNMALTVIANQTLRYYKFAGRQLNSVGQDVTIYSAPLEIVGSFQPLPKTLYMQYGLDLQKSYFTFYSSNNVIDVTRSVAGDQIAFNGQRYQCESTVDWYVVDGWKAILCIHIGQDTANSKVFGFGATNQNFGNGSFQSEAV